MTERKVFQLVHAEARRRAMAAVAEAPHGWRVEVKEPTRDLTINAALHATISEIADRVEWAGHHWDIEVWKRLLVAAWSRAIGESAAVLPALDGHGVDIVFRRTSKLSQREMRDLMAFSDAWKAERPEFQKEEA
jgi:hypothetical protein